MKIDFTHWPEYFHKLTGRSPTSLEIAEAVKKQSDYYIQNPTKETQWEDPQVVIAQFFYYTPLNYLRVQRAKAQGDFFNFFESTKTVFDYGCGLGAGFLNFSGSDLKIIGHDQSKELYKMIEKLCKILNTDIHLSTELPKEPLADSLFLASFSVTETENPNKMLKILKKFDQQMMVEPATQTDSRNLQKFRQVLINHDWHIWAPCTHQDRCPLLENSKTDWCHDKIHFDLPDWFKSVQEILPMKLRDLSLSYLLASKQKMDLPKNYARIIGDVQNEKGKTRLMSCSDSTRMFISALSREKTELNLLRGDLVEIPSDVKKLNNEIRTQIPIKLVYRN
jgi:hypothetical protein